ncbi:facilitated trehalose transporter Tret1-like [Nasonia vitripennis]|uniref:Major facilitator superfamily (MFS) profile domain-containing protein n=1 Tax=Nasonia vitripennis TaxID=7425 RepID=A0A7M7T8V1_NASVI|nr:facilitated trehalose transporter Tret1-like [Nasonia vitripennis]
MVYSVSQTVKSATSQRSYTQWIATAGVLLLMLQTGIMAGWTSPNIARLTSENSTLPLTLNEASWVASCLNLGRFVGALLVPVLIEYVGSKKTIIFVFSPVSVSWVFMMVGNSVEWFYAARFLGGISFGMAYGCFSLFLGEVSSPTIRGTLISMAMIGAPLGTVIGTICESYLPMSVSSAYLAQCLVGIILFMWLPDSAYYLVKRKDVTGARKSIAWYRGEQELDKELDAVQGFVEANAGKTVADNLREFKSAPIRKAMILVIILFIFPQMCGLFNILFYMEIILTKGKSFLVNPQEFVIYANVVSVVSTTLAIQLIDKLGRRFLLMVSSIGTTTAMIGLGTHFYLLSTDVDPGKLQWLPIASILLFTFTFTIGFMTVPSTVLSEIFPSSVKSAAASISSFTSAFFGFVAAKAYQPMVDGIGEAYVFWIHAGFSALAVPTALFLLPETKGKTFQEIQDILHRK